MALASVPHRIVEVAAVAALECRLERGATQVDFEICLRAAGGERARLAAELDELERAAPAGDPGWRRALGFLREWCDPASPLHDGVPVVWLEFDLHDRCGPSPAPFVIVTLAAGRPGGTAPRIDAVVERALALLGGGGSITADTRATLERVLDGLPAGGRFVHLAVRPTSDGDLLRVIVKLRSDAITEYLHRIGWPGEGAELDAWLAASCRATPTPSVNLDVLPGRVGPRVGIEYYFDGAPRTDPRWRNVLDLLESAGACTAERRAQLEAWPSAADPTPRDERTRIERELLLKVVHEPGTPLRAKAYLPFASAARC